jgi:hypothetical protein
MVASCRLCGAESPADAFFCVSCGSVLHGDHGRIRSLGITGPAVRLESPAIGPALPFERTSRPSWTWRAALRTIGIPVVGFGFCIIFLIGIMQVIEHGGLPPLGLWAVGPVVMGALLAEQEWVNGRIWRGLFGMLIWSGIPWLLALNSHPWGALLGIAWLALHFGFRRT